MAQLTELEALNHILSAVGSQAMSGVDEFRPDGDAARQRLKEANIWLQKKGWWFNTTYTHRMIPQGPTNIVILPANTMRILNACDEVTNESLLLTNRHERAYNMRERTDRFPNAIIADIVQRLDWDLLPGSAQECAMYMGAQKMIIHELEDYRKAESYDSDIALALRDLRIEDLEVKRRTDARYTLLNWHGRRAAFGVRPYRRSGSRYRNPVFPGGGL